MNRVLRYLLAGTRGGEMRARILLLIKEEPRNANRLAQDLAVDYTTVKHHLRVLLKHDVVTAEGGYSALYFLTDETRDSWDDLGTIWERIRKTAKYGGEKR